MENKIKVALITGASSGIGRAIARSMAEIGTNLILCARRIERIQELCDELEKEYSVKALPLQMDVRDYEGIKAVLSSVPEEMKQVDLLVNNAGLSLRADKVQNADIANFDAMTDTNFKGVYYMTNLIIPGMIERNRGHIVNIGSIAGLAAYSTGSVYCASKAAVKTFTEALRLDVHGSELRVTLIEPGMTATEFMNVKTGDNEDHYSGLEAMTAEDIANCVKFAVTCPPHVNVCEMVVMPTHQASATQMYHR